MSEAAPIISFVIPVRNDQGRLARCLRTIAMRDSPDIPIECIVADNGSADGSALTARSLGAKVLSLPGLNVSAVRNRAASFARGRILAFVDADHELGNQWISAAVDVFEDDAVGAAGALYLAPPGGTWVQRMYGHLRGRTVGRADTAWLSSGNLAVRRATFKEIGGFDESLQTCEDVDLCQRIRQSGRRIVADERLQSVHTGDPATLAELFSSERWRGRDNLRVSFRSMSRVTDLASVLIPVLDAASLAAGAVSFALAPFAGSGALSIAAGSAAVMVALAGLRVTRMMGAGRLRRPLELAQAFLVALVYDAGRACSLVWPAPHRRSRPDPSQLAPDRMA